MAAHVRTYFSLLKKSTSGRVYRNQCLYKHTHKPTKFRKRVDPNLSDIDTQADSDIFGEADPEFPKRAPRVHGIFDPYAAKLMEDQGVKDKFRHHPGIRKIHQAQLPEQVDKTITYILEKNSMSRKGLEEDGILLNWKLWHRKQPMHDDEMRGWVDRLFGELYAQAEEKYDLDSITPEQEERLQKSIADVVKKKVRNTQRNWDDIKYDKYTSLCYAVGRFVQEYGIMRRVFNEIVLHDKEFQPKTLLDFGSGVGTVTWAANTYWKDSLKEYYCIDESEEMHDLADILMRGGEFEADSCFKNVAFRRFFPHHEKNQWDVVVSAFTLLEMKTEEERLKLVEDLWGKTKTYLVLVDFGTKAGFADMLEVRNCLLNITENAKNNKKEKHKQGYLVAPCPHSLTCPRAAKYESPCNFEVGYKPYRLHEASQKSRDRNFERFTFMIFKKGKRVEEALPWPRIVRYAKKRKQHIHVELCTVKGELLPTFITKRRHGRELYRSMRCSYWGDLLPMQIDHVEIMPERKPGEQAKKFEKLRRKRKSYLHQTDDSQISDEQDNKFSEEQVSREQEHIKKQAKTPKKQLRRGKPKPRRRDLDDTENNLQARADREQSNIAEAFASIRKKSSI